MEIQPVPSNFFPKLEANNKLFKSFVFFCSKISSNFAYLSVKFSPKYFVAGL